jgi:hypothetical protein
MSIELDCKRAAVGFRRLPVAPPPRRLNSAGSRLLLPGYHEETIMERVERRKKDRSGTEIPAGVGAEAGSRGTAGTGGAGYTNPGGSTGAGSARHDADPDVPGHDTDYASSPVGKPESSSGSRRPDAKNQGHMEGHAEEDVPNDAWPFPGEIKKP